MYLTGLAKNCCPTSVSCHLYNVRATPTKHPPPFAGALTDLFLPSYEDDKPWIEKLIESGEATESEVNGNFRGSPWRRHCRRFMVTVGDTDGIDKLKGNLDKLLKEHSDKVDKNQNSLITPEARKAVKRAKKPLDDGMLGDPAGVNMYFLLNPGAEGSPLQSVARARRFWKIATICAGGEYQPDAYDIRSLRSSVSSCV